MTELFDNTLAAESLVPKEQSDVLGMPLADVVTKIQVKRDTLIAKKAEMSAAEKIGATNEIGEQKLREAQTLAEENDYLIVFLISSAAA